MDVSGWSIANLEPRGGGPNAWLYSGLGRWLFKPVSTVRWGRQGEDWAVVRPESLGAPDLLCPSYDHGSSLGFNLMVELLVVNRRRLLDVC